jgi:hypothetical protein
VRPSRRLAGLITGLLASAFAGALIQAPAAHAAAERAFILRVQVTHAATVVSPANSVITQVIKPDGTRISTTCYYVTPAQWTDIALSAPVGYTVAVWASQSCYNALVLDSITVTSTTTIFQTQLNQRR